MAKTIDISAKLTNERPRLKLAEGVEFEIDNRKNTVLILDQRLKEMDFSDLKQVDEALELLLGEESVQKINEMNISFADYQTIFMAALAGATGEEYETVEARFQRARQET
jgi:hypothetical protein